MNAGKANAAPAIWPSILRRVVFFLKGMDLYSRLRQIDLEIGCKCNCEWDF